ncbi:hypothetical protein COV19_05005 [Candidatus Woesearchaeota archaeon CG10_big_fil_rev_8_21_14_0_10_44_13]|nr:MAG: hypothetical protein COV19_05005 [Candidatus Woesearchaeota archaeon CG10_big_fil_rev_8_21_14_0_10_44_13]
MNIPYCFFPENFVKRGSSLFYWLSDFIRKSKPEIELDFKRAEIKTSVSAYISAALFSDFVLFLFMTLFVSMILLRYRSGYALAIAVLVSFVISLFIFFQQMTYPRVIVNKKVKSIERYLLPALRTMQIQVSSGIPLYDIITSISNEDYGGVSEQFKKAIKEINAGMHQINALENVAAENPSLYFQRIIWQIITAVKSGSDLGVVLNEIVQSLAEEQIVQVQEYGSKLNPLTMFYMLIVVVVPALALTFFVVIGSFISINSSTLKALFWGMYVVVMFFQLFFLSMISSKRPNLL